MSDIKSYTGEESNDLKPCPFCGGEARIDAMPTLREGEDAYQCFCTGGCAASSAYYDSLEDTKAAWNSRPIEDGLHAENARLREALRWRSVEGEPPPDMEDVAFYTPTDDELGYTEFVCMSYIDWQGRLETSNVWQWEDGMYPTLWRPIQMPLPEEVQG